MNPAERRAHRLAATLLNYLIGNTHALTQELDTLAGELRGDADGPDAAPLPTTLPSVIRLVDAGEGIHFGQLVAALYPDPDSAGNALAELLTTVENAIERENAIEGLFTALDPLITAVVAAAVNGHTPIELTNILNELGVLVDHPALITALRRVLAGARDRAKLLNGLDDIETAILTRVLDRLSTSPEQHP